MTTDEENLIIKNINIAYKLGWRYYTKFNGLFELEDLQSVCMLGLIKAGTTFKSELGFQFSTYAYGCIQNEVKRFYRDNKKHFNNISLSIVLGDDLEIEDTLADDYDLLEDIQKSEDLKTLYNEISTLKPRYKEIIEYKLKGYTFAKIGKIIGLSVPQVSNYYNKAINILRYRFKVERGEIDYE